MATTMPVTNWATMPRCWPAMLTATTSAGWRSTAPARTSTRRWGSWTTTGSPSARANERAREDLVLGGLIGLLVDD